MSRITTVLAVLAAALLMAACAQTPRSAERKGRIIALSDSLLTIQSTDTVRFGHTRSGEIAVQRIWIENRTTRPIVILDYARTCGCILFEFDPQPIKPGEAQQITLTLDTRGQRGWLLKTLDIRFSGAKYPTRLFVEADVE